MCKSINDGSITFKKLIKSEGKEYRKRLALKIKKAFQEELTDQSEAESSLMADAPSNKNC